MLILCEAYHFSTWNKRLVVFRLLHHNDLNSASTGEVVGAVSQHVQADIGTVCFENSHGISIFALQLGGGFW